MLKTTRRINELVENYASSEKRVNRLTESQLCLDGTDREDQELYIKIESDIQKEEQGKKSVVRQLEEETGEELYDVIGRLSNYIDSGARSIVDFYNIK